jgi:serine phosphatase RsbU (regulator of sigma subunit)
MMIRALLVDDETPARARLRRLLDERGVEVVGEAADGEQALQRVDELRPDVVFLDIQMPGLSGLDVAARLGPPRPRVIFCTAFNEFAIQAFEHQAIDYLLKPVNGQRLSRTLDRVGRDLGEQRQRAREDEEAARTQTRLMPALPAPGATLDCAALYLPARNIGGDYYDILPFGAGRVGLALGDVSGKGTDAGLLVAALQARIQTVAARGMIAPSELLRAVNELTVGKMEDHRYATVFFGLYDGGQGSFRCSSAGHPPSLLVCADGTLRELDAGGPPIGWPEGLVYGEDSVSVREGDTIVAYSDGITEARSPSGDEFGLERLARLIQDGRAAPPEALVERVRHALAEFGAGTAPEDDRTLLVARVTGTRAAVR